MAAAACWQAAAAACCKRHHANQNFLPLSAVLCAGSVKTVVLGVKAGSNGALQNSSNNTQLRKKKKQFSRGARGRNVAAASAGIAAIFGKLRGAMASCTWGRWLQLHAFVREHYPKPSSSSASSFFFSSFKFFSESLAAILPAIQPGDSPLFQNSVRTQCHCAPPFRHHLIVVLDPPRIADLASAIERAQGFRSSAVAAASACTQRSARVLASSTSGCELSFAASTS